jgi:hypothetical protein
MNIENLFNDTGGSVCIGISYNSPKYDFRNSNKNIFDCKRKDDDIVNGLSRFSKIEKEDILKSALLQVKG